MSDHSDHANRIARMMRLHGASPEHRENLRKFLHERLDWYGRCRHCKKDVSGSVEEAMAHRCEK